MLYSRTIGTDPRHIIFIHGNSQNISVWDKVISEQHLAEKFSCVLIDIAGHGDSKAGMGEEDYSFPAICKHVKSALLPFESHPYILVGHSLGSNIIGEIADEIRNCSGFFMLAPDMLGGGYELSDILVEGTTSSILFKDQPTFEELDGYATETLHDSTNGSKSLVKKMYYDTDPLVRVSMYQSLIKQEFRDEIALLAATNRPIALVYGEYEKFCHIDYLKSSTLKMWRNEIIIIKDAGHTVQLDQPKELSKLIIEFAEDCFK